MLCVSLLIRKLFIKFFIYRILFYNYVKHLLTIFLLIILAMIKTKINNNERKICTGNYIDKKQYLI